MDRENTLQSEQLLDHVPQEIIEEILSRLPVKSLLRLRCVSKSWLSLIGSKFLINKHLQNSMARRRAISSMDDPTNDHLMATTGEFVGCCNGLLCTYEETSDSLFLWNPALRISTELPKIDHKYIFVKYGFGWDEQSDAYKVFVIMPCSERLTGRVYNSKTNLWKTVEKGYLSLYNRRAIFACGKIYWFTHYSHNQIEYFDLKSEEFGMIEQPCHPEPDDGNVYLSIGERGGCLALVSIYLRHNKTCIDLWVMKQYGVKESWELMKHRTSSEFPPRYNPQSEFSPCYDPYLHVESLVSPVPDENL